MRLGDDKIIPVNVRIVAATNKNLLRMVREGEFREDLFFRLNVLTLYLPPIRERKSDIRILMDHYLEIFAEKMNRSKVSLAEDAAELLVSYDWPGNVREISNLAELIAVTCSGSQISGREIRELMQHSFNAAPQPVKTEEPDEDEKEWERIRAALDSCRGNKAAAAALLGISRPTLYRRLREHTQNIR